jgi:hypothetical protein
MFFRLCLGVFCLTLLGLADNVATLTDPFGAAAVACAPADHPNYEDCDVIGAKTDFDIQMAVINFNSSEITIDYYLNYREGAVTDTALNPFNVSGLLLSPGDILISDASGQNVYGIAMSGSTAGSVYSNITPLTAGDVLDVPTPPWYYRVNREVAIGGDPTLEGNASFNVASYGNGTTAAEYKVSLVLDSAASAFLYNAAVANGGWLDWHFQSLNCGNDILDGRVGVPEPSEYALLGTLVGLIGFGVRRRRQSALAA